MKSEFIFTYANEQNRETKIYRQMKNKIKINRKILYGHNKDAFHLSKNYIIIHVPNQGRTLEVTTEVEQFLIQFVVYDILQALKTKPFTLIKRCMQFLQNNI